MLGALVALLWAHEGTAAESGLTPGRIADAGQALRLEVEGYLDRPSRRWAGSNGAGPLLAILGGSDAGDAPNFQAGSEDDETPEQAAARWSSFLPLLGRQAREKGHDLPLPFGVGVSTSYFKRHGRVESVQARLNGGPWQSVEALGFEPKTEVFTTMARFDAWILPFLNVYGLVGYCWNLSSTKVTIRRPGGDPADLTTLDTEMEGPTYGGGVTLAAGFSNFFLTLDYNLVTVDLDQVDSRMTAGLATARFGWYQTFGGTEVRLWTGATYWDTKRTVNVSVPLPGDNLLDAAIVQGPRREWTAVLGTNIEVGRVWFVVAEFQFNDRDFVSILSFSYRF